MRVQWYCQNIEAISGYSDEARVMVKGLLNLGVDVTIVGGSHKGTLLGFKRSATIDPLDPIVYHTYRHNSYRPHPQGHGAVRTMLEVTSIPQSWVYHFRRMNEIWVPNSFNYHTFSISGVPKEKLYIVPSAVDLKDPRAIRSYPVKSRKKFKFLSILNYQARDRKGLDILLKTFRESFAKTDDVCLLIKGKTSMQQLARDYNIGTDGPEIEVIDKILSRPEILGLHRTADCFILPSRGEGVGRPLLDAMMMGTPIITTGWGGPADYLNRSNAWLVDYRLVPVVTRYYLRNPGLYGSQWAEPAVRDLALKMKQVISHPQKAEVLAKKAQRDVTLFSQEKVCRLVESRIRDGMNQHKMREGPPASIFEKLFPIYYPGLSNGPDIQARSRQDFHSPVESLILTGHGRALHRAAHFFHSRRDIHRIYFVELGQASQPSPAVLLPVKTSMSRAKKSASIVVIAASQSDIPDIYQRILSQMNSLPLYVFM